MAGAVTATTVTVLPVFLTGGLAVQISAELDFDPAGLGLAVALFFGVSALAALPAGWLVERFGSGPTSRAGVLGSAAGMLAVAAWAHSFPVLVAILLCSAWCNVLGQLSSNLTLARYVPAERLGLSFGIKQSAIPLATLIAGAAVPAVALTVGWRWAYVLGAGLALAALFIAPRDTAGRERTLATPGERAIVQVGVYGGGFGGPVGFGVLAAQTSFPTAWLAAAATMLVAAGLMVLGRRMLVAHRTAREARASH